MSSDSLFRCTTWGYHAEPIESITRTLLTPQNIQKLKNMKENQIQLNENRENTTSLIGRSESGLASIMHKGNRFWVCELSFTETGRDTSICILVIQQAERNHVRSFAMSINILEVITQKTEITNIFSLAWDELKIELHFHAENN